MNFKTALLAAISLTLPAILSAQPAAPDPQHDQLCTEFKSINEQEKGQMQSFEAQLKTLREQMKGIEEQRKAAAEKFRAQRDALMEKLSPDGAAARLAYEAKIKALGEKEQAALKREEGEMRELRESYNAKRKAVPVPKLNLNCK